MVLISLLHISHNIRNPRLFYIPYASLRYMLSSPAQLMNGNSVNTEIDFFFKYTLWVIGTYHVIIIFI